MFGKENEGRGRLQIKICGITNEVDALAAIESGADALGFNFVPRSKRYIDIKVAADWIAALPAKAIRVAVVADPSWEEAMAIADFPFVDALQLHGNESPAFCQRLAGCGIRFAKAVPGSGEISPRNAPSYGTSTIVLDSSTAEGFGGTGQTFSWRLARQFIDANPTLEVVLAGGLTPENVGRAVADVRPFGVDVTSGVESTLGRKDHARVRAFIKAARQGRD